LLQSLSCSVCSRHLVRHKTTSVSCKTWSIVGDWKVILEDLTSTSASLWN